MHTITSFRAGLLPWFTEHQRPLPWRKDYQPYQIWIAEIMGQQTQMERVVVYFQSWIQQFPDIRALAAASEQEIFKAWEGLGYYSRARNLRKTAELLVRDHHGELPNEEAALLALPGIGPYTAAAILSIAFNQPVPLLDANVERVLCRVEDIDSPPKQSVTRKQLLQLCAELLPPNEPRNFNQALMELGALICTPKNPTCAACPVRECCRAFAAGTVNQRPVLVKKPDKINIIMACGIIEQDGRFYIQQRREEDVWGGLWEFPGGRLKEGETPEQAAAREIAEETEFRVIHLRPFTTVVHHYTKHRVTLHSFFCNLQNEQSTEPVLHAASQFRWVNQKELDSFAFPSGHRQLIKNMATYIFDA
ncbi:MAG: A/G-specific DNA-adenine glycosylase [Candidatus Electronema aureum]|uniref:Adenine DNA glycosylase n=1 Tax=Candidatus Electronema aureum TaxID=2005002 RepID=A0A521G4E8_9BACT|nr:MAG: A/G-specific DNA-adenine glycosylase [Candidatus Electronema aureum]